MEKENNHSDEPFRKRILHFNSHNGPVSIEIDKVLFFNAEGSYSIVYMEGNKQIKTVTHNLCYFERLFESMGENFLRCHYCWLVNISKIISCYRADRLLIIADYAIRVSRDRWSEIRWIISDRGIRINKELSPDIKILPGYKKY